MVQQGEALQVINNEESARIFRGWAKMKQETREMAFALTNGYCGCCKECVEQADQVHHLLPNTDVNRKLFPLFTDSIFNLCGIFSGCHLNKPIPTIRPEQAKIYEEWLQKNTKGAAK